MCAAIAGLQDFRQEGPPADIGTFQLPCSILVFQHTFSGTTYICAVRSGVRGWILVSYGTVAATVINAARAAITSGDIFLNAGAAYVMATPFQIASNIKLHGAGEGSILQAGANITALIVNTNFGAGPTSYFCIENLALDGVKATYTCNGIDVETAAGQPVSHGRITNVHIYLCSGDAIRLDYARVIMIQNNVLGGWLANGAAIGNNGNGINMTNMFDAVIIGNHILNNVGRGIYFQSGYSSSITGNYIAHNTNTGIECAVTSCNISANSILQNGQKGILLTNAAELCNITSNLVYGNEVWGIHVQGANNNISANTVCTNTGHGIVGAGAQLTVTGNMLKGNTLNAIYLANSAASTVCGNDVMANGGDGIYVGAYSSETLVSGNVMRENGGWGIQIDGDNDAVKIHGNRTYVNTSGSCRVNDAGCVHTHISDNTFEEGAISDAGTSTRAWLNYDPSANAFIATINAPTVVGGGGGALP